MLSSGAPVPVDVLRRMKDCINEQGDMHTPYGATEALPVASIAAGEVLGETAEKTRQGAGTCVGPKFAGIEWKVIRIVDGPIPTINDIEELPAGEIGELIVSGPQVTRCYVTRVEANRTAKIAERIESVGATVELSPQHGNRIWHRMGDAGYFDEKGAILVLRRLRIACSRPAEPLYPVRCEAIFNQHPDISARPSWASVAAGNQRPVIVLEPKPGKFPRTAAAKKTLLDEIRRLGQASPLTESITDFLLHRSFPVDIRHNAKIFREKLAVWAANRLRP